MAYEVLARKWRPKQMSDVIGQEHVTRTLRHAIESGRVAHAYLFVGPRGIGKTTLSRIFAKALNCEHGPTADPCDQCELCREIMAGNSLDVIEIDAASNNGVDNIRELKESIQFAPARAKYKIYIIDEVHMLSVGAFNALLKTLEEPPPHAKFIFATTDVEKLPATIISRCQRFDLHRIPTTLIVDYLKHVSTEEGINVAPDALLAIARGADGGMRDALGALDQIISFKGNDIGESDVLAIFGLASRTQLESLASCILKGDMAGGLRIIDELDRHGKDLRRIAVELMEHFRNLIVRQQLGADAMSALDVTSEQLATLDEQAKLADAGRLIRIAEHFADLDDRIRTALSRRTIFETTFLRCCRAATVATIDQLIRQISALPPAALPAGNAPAATQPVRAPEPPRAAPLQQRPVQRTVEPTTASATAPSIPPPPPPAQRTVARPPVPPPAAPAAQPRRYAPVPPRPPAPPPRPTIAKVQPQAPTERQVDKPIAKAMENPVIQEAVKLFNGEVTDVIERKPTTDA